MNPGFAENKWSPPRGGAPAQDDNALVLRTIAGDNTAFDTLVRRYTRLVMSLTRRMTASIEDAEDVAQQAFMKAFINLSKFRFRCSFSTWLVSIAMNEARMLGRKHRRSREVPMVSTGTASEPPIQLDFPDHRPNPEGNYLDREWLGLVWQEIECLPPITRAAIEICDLDRVSTFDTAIRLGTTVAAVKSRRSRGRAALRRRLEAHFLGIYLAQKS